jgi:ATP-dependent helicase/nuclease subunit A
MPEVPKTKHPFKVYRSSAGSGKTYTLALDYVYLALRDPLYFKSILAVTFTNKATQEMKERVIKFLKDLSAGNDSQLEQQVIAYTQYDIADLKVRAGAALSAILHNYSSFSVKTIDSFFQQVLRAFTRELGLLGDFELELDSRKVTGAAIDMLMQEVGKDKDLTTWLLDFVREKINEGSKYDSRNAIAQLASEIYKEDFQAYKSTLEGLSANPEILLELRKKIYAAINFIESTYAEMGREALGIIDKSEFSFDDFIRMRQGPCGLFLKATIGFIGPNSFALIPYKDGTGWVKKTGSPAAREFAEQHLQSRLEKMIDFYTANSERYYSAKAIQASLFTYGVIIKLLAKIVEYKKQEDILLLADTPAILREIIGENEVPYIYEKVGTQFQHYLIDEFQDTSGMQWENFKPLVLNSMASQNEGLVVGDVKQSIYRWRGGNWKLLLEKIEDDLDFGFESVNLDQNYRSRKNIIEFNNLLYQKLPGLLNNKLGFKDDKSLISKAYKEVNQFLPVHKAGDKEKGYIRLTFLESVDENEEGEEVKWKEAVPEHLINILKELQDAGYALKDIAILTRKTGEGNEIINHLLQHQANQEAESKYRFDVISKEALRIGDSQAVQCIINCMQICIDGNDGIAKTSLLNTWLRLKSNKEEIHQLPNLEHILDPLPQAFKDELPILSRFSLFELTEKVIQLLDLRIDGQIAYLQAFEDSILKFESMHTSELKTFITWWEEEGSSKSVITSDEQNAIRVLTIHKSKGLQFPIVIMPFISWDLDHSSSHFIKNYLWTTNESSGLLNTESGDLPFPITYSKDLELSTFKELYLEEKLQAYLDNLNLLYVATTRAEEGLFCFSNFPKNRDNSNIKTVADLLYQGLWINYKDWKSAFPNHFQYDEVLKRICIGDFPFNSKKSRAHQGIKIDEFPIQFWHNRIKIRSRSQWWAQKLESELPDQRTFGLLAHRVLEKLDHPKNLDKVLEQMLFMGEISQNEKEALARHLQKLNENKIIRSWFLPEWAIRTENAILQPGGERNRPDRVIIKDDEAIVIDYKTGIEKEKNKKQVSDYMQLLLKMGLKNVKGYLLYTENMKVVEVNNA